MSLYDLELGAGLVPSESAVIRRVENLHRVLHRDLQSIHCRGGVLVVQLDSKEIGADMLLVY